jgi:hypothetical protein
MMSEEKLQFALDAMGSFIQGLSGLDLLSHTVGLVGMSCVVGAYYTIERGKYTRDDPAYYIINLIGAILLTISLFFNFNLGSFVIEIFWMAISINGLRRIFKNRR